MANEELTNMFSPILVTHLPRLRSYHNAQARHTDGRMKLKFFRFEQCWTKEDKCEDIVRKSW